MKLGALAVMLRCPEDQDVRFINNKNLSIGLKIAGERGQEWGWGVDKLNFTAFSFNDNSFR